jgi:Major Facilitator Superfamily
MSADITGLRRRFVLLTGLRWVPVGFTAPLLVLLPLSRGLTLGQVGLTMACYAATTALLELPTGGLADAVGRRPVLVASSVLSVVVFASMLVADGLGPWIAIKVLAGAARALDSGPLEAWYVDEVRRLDPTADIRKGLSRAHAAEGGGLALSAVTGGLLPVAIGGTLNAAVFAALVAQGVQLAGVVALVTDDRTSGHRAPARAAGRVPDVIRTGLAIGMKRGPVCWLLCGSAVWGVALAGIELLWQPRFTDLLGGRSDTGPLGFLMAGAFLPAAAGPAMAPRLARLVGGGTSRAAMACTLTQATSYMGLAAAGSIALAAPTFVMVYLLGGARGPFHNELLHEHVAAAQRSTMLSAVSLSLMAGGLVSTLSLPVLVGMAGIPWTWALVGGVLAASALLYLAIPDRPASAAAPSDPATAPVAVA